MQGPSVPREILLTGGMGGALCDAGTGTGGGAQQVGATCRSRPRAAGGAASADPAAGQNALGSCRQMLVTVRSMPPSCWYGCARHKRKFLKFGSTVPGLMHLSCNSRGVQRSSRLSMIAAGSPSRQGCLVRQDKPARLYF
jgi:hypothetical protein